MLDLNFVRDNLPLVEEKLRQRGMNPAEVLKDFAAIDAARRQAITASETLQARRNRASEEIAKLKKSGQDASAQINETKELREQIAESEKKAAEQEARLREILTTHSESSPCRACRWGRARTITLRRGAGARLRNLISSPSRIGSWANRSACSTWSAPRNCRALASPFTGRWVRDWSGRSRTSCSICTPASMDTRRFCRLSW